MHGVCAHAGTGERPKYRYLVDPLNWFNVPHAQIVIRDINRHGWWCCTYWSCCLALGAGLGLWNYTWCWFLVCPWHGQFVYTVKATNKVLTA